MESNFSFTNYHIEELQILENLSERSKNVCIGSSIDTLYKIVQYFFDYGNFKDIRNCGIKTNIELVNLCRKYIEASSINREDLILDRKMEGFEEFKHFCFSAFRMPSGITDTYRNAYLAFDFPLANFLSRLSHFIFNQREQFIFENNFGFLNTSSKRTLQTIGDQFNITRERVRQIAQKVPEKIEYSLSRITDRFPQFVDHVECDLDLKKEILVIDKEFAEKCNRNEGVNFTPKLYALMVSSLNYHTFSMVQDIEKVYSKYFLVSVAHAQSFDFGRFITEIENRLNHRRVADVKELFDGFLLPFVKPGANLDDHLRQICKRIAEEGFGIGFEGNQMIFKRNSLVKLSEHIVAVLREKGRPLRLSEIAKELRHRIKRVPPNMESLRSSILGIEEVAAIGKTSTYALKEWDSVNTGTIKQIVRDLLEESSDPVHINDITEYVCKFRQTSDKNILSNLKLDKSNTFAFFKLGYVGLKFKHYKNIQLQGKAHSGGHDGHKANASQLKLL